MNRASPNSEVTETKNADDLNGSQTTMDGSRYGRGGDSPADSEDSEYTKIVSTSPGV